VTFRLRKPSCLSEGNSWNSAGSCCINTECTPGKYGTGGNNGTCASCTNKPANALSATYSTSGCGVNSCDYNVVTCPAAYWWNSQQSSLTSSCNSCNVGTWSASGSTSCSLCTNQTIGKCWTTNGTSANGCGDRDCNNKLGASHYTSHGGDCSPSPLPDRCFYACNAGYGSLECTQCPASTFDSSPGATEPCTNCEVGKWSSAGATSCSWCTNTHIGRFWISNGTTSTGCSFALCTNGINGKYWTSHGGTSATGCQQADCTNKQGNSYYIGHGDTTNSCGYACSAGYGTSACTQCSASNYDSVAGGQEACASCAIGQWSSAGATSCSACTNTTIGQYWTSKGTSATSCTNTACTNKPANSSYTSHGGTTNTCAWTCDSGYTQDGSSCIPDACNPGYGGTPCNQCVASTYDSVPGGVEACVNCQIGKWSSAGATSCSNCTNALIGQFWTSNGTSESSCTNASCTNATVGKYWTSHGGTSATGCLDTTCTNKQGTSTYTSHGGTTNSCGYACSTGYGSSACTQCSASTYDSVAGGQEACASCAIGKWSSAGATSCSNCTNAPVGQYWTSNGTSATSCTNASCINALVGKYWTTHGGTFALGCQDADCTTGQGNFLYSTHGGTTNSCDYVCFAGHGSKACTQCTASTYDSVEGGKEGCINCPVGKWSSAGSTSCSDCTNAPTGQYWTSNGTSATSCTNTACTNKPANSFYTSHGGTSNNCSWSCSPGYTWNGSSCVSNQICTPYQYGECSYHLSCPDTSAQYVCNSTGTGWDIYCGPCI